VSHCEFFTPKIQNFNPIRLVLHSNNRSIKKLGFYRPISERSQVGKSINCSLVDNIIAAGHFIDISFITFNFALTAKNGSHMLNHLE